MSFVFQDNGIINNPAVWAPLKRKAFPQGRVLLWWTYWLDAHLWGNDAKGWRWTSALIHAINALLLGCSTKSLAAAMLFYLHPLTVMGSGYVAGRSGALVTTFQLCALWSVLEGFWALAITFAMVATLWVKEDAVSIFPFIGVLWLTS